ncbi:MAG: sulfotransferase domain-containing protein, partial [Actinomycetia bacterium]|nr:sulfotransferase domain-containing protein [Actinomycetes bacterium]
MSSTVKDVGRKAALVAADQIGQRTASRRVLPDMLIVGGQRCGTTTLFKALAQHRAFLGPTLRKGVHYFDLRADQSLDWYRAHFPTRGAVENLRRAGDGRVVVGESSPYYLWHPLAADRIARTLPAVRVVALLRDPVERAYSAHAHELARGFETESFEDALALEDQRLAGEEDPLRSGAPARSLAPQH